jgi:hypothetical protein
LSSEYDSPKCTYYEKVIYLSSILPD